MTREKAIELLKSGNYTIYYHDYCECTLYEGKWFEEEIRDDYPSASLDMRDCYDGYIPEIVDLMNEALGGNLWTV